MKRHIYTAKKPDAKGYIQYTDEEHSVWHDLYTRQRPIVEQFACPEFIEGLDAIQLSADHIPQCKDISKALEQHTGWAVVPVEALISFEEFFNLLATKRFPAASFIRIREELDYLQEPDIFHEVFGHCPLLSNPDFAKFTEAFGKIGLKADKKDRARLARLYWFTAEFGLIKNKIYGAGILSSKSETLYAGESEKPRREPFDMLTALRTPYRYDIIQTLYYVIEDFKTLYTMVEHDLLGLLQQAKAMGDIERTFDDPEPEPEDMRSC